MTGAAARAQFGGMAEDGRDFLTRHFGAVLTALVAVAGLTVGYYQFSVQTERAEREERLALARFVVDNYEALFPDGDALRPAHMEAVMQAAFPEDLTERFARVRAEQLTLAAREATSADTVRRASDQLALLPPAPAVAVAPPSGTEPIMIAPSARVFVHYGDGADLPAVERLLEALRDEGFRVPAPDLQAGVTIRAADVRHFDNAAEGDVVARLLAEALPGAPLREGVPRNLSTSFPNMPADVIEVWLPRLSPSP